MNVAIIPARGGSKRIARKNIRSFCGRPIIAYVIETASRSGCFDRVLVSTDDEEIAAVARSLGAVVPGLRPAQLADDHATTDEVFRHALLEMAGPPGELEYACCIYPTSPMLGVEDLVEGLGVLQTSDCDSVVSVTDYDFPIQQALALDDGFVRPVDPRAMDLRSQDLAEYFHDAGMFYWVRAPAFLASGRIFDRKTGRVKIPATRSQDINTEEDWLLAEWKFAHLNANKAKNRP